MPAALKIMDLAGNMIRREPRAAWSRIRLPRCSGVEGLKVAEAETEAGGSVTVWGITDHPDTALCPDCRTRSFRVHVHVLTRPRYLRPGLDEADRRWPTLR